MKKTGVLFASVYAAFVAASALYIFYRINFQPANSEFCGLPLILLTEPWSMILLPLLQKAGFESRSALTNTLLLIFPCAFINGLILYFLGSLMDKSGNKG